MRQLIALQTIPTLVPYDKGDKMMAKVVHHFSCTSLTIGKWRRLRQNAKGLVIFYSPDKARMTYYIDNDQAGYKIEYPFSYIKNIFLENEDGETPGGLVVELKFPPRFSMNSTEWGQFYQSGDFTEDQQASQVMTHYLGGDPKVLSGQLAKLVSLESFITRHHAIVNHTPLPDAQRSSNTRSRSM